MYFNHLKKAVLIGVLLAFGFAMMPSQTYGNEDSGWIDDDLYPFKKVRPVILLTGYWPPSNRMLCKFHLDPASHYECGDKFTCEGENWEHTGYNIVAYFPEHCFEDPPHEFCHRKCCGDMEVDYQDVGGLGFMTPEGDFWRLVKHYEPIAVISFGRGGRRQMQFEFNYPNRKEKWSSDYQEPWKPTPSPPDSTIPVCDPEWGQNLEYETLEDGVRHSTLPMSAMVNAINEVLPPIDYYDPPRPFAYIDLTGSPGGFLCGYTGLLDAMYCDNEDNCKAAGFIHVGSRMDVDELRMALDIALHVLIDYLEGLSVNDDVPNPNYEFDDGEGDGDGQLL
jgi:hypothetical protein